MRRSASQPLFRAPRSAAQAAGGAASPPVTVGVGIGGSFDKVTAIAKQANLRDIGQHHPEPHIAQLETELL
ncbi:fumarate hydratase, partial [Bordetella bronchiseptica]